MKTFRPNQRLSFIFGAFFFMLFFQSCEKETLTDLNSEVNAPAAKGSELIEWSADVPDPCKEVCLVAGQQMYVGTVEAAMAGEDLLVTYKISEPNVYLLEVHLDVFSSLAELKADKKLSNGGAIPGKFSFTKSWSANEGVTSYTVVVPGSYLAEVGGECFFIASHAALSNGETAWGGLCEQTEDGVSLDVAKQFPGKNWSVYFEFCPDECRESIDFTYAWEDLLDYSNDLDYNDLVIQSDITKSASELKITFLATARGAAWDHQFKFKIPKAGITNIFGASSVEVEGDDYIVTVFESTKEALPPELSQPYRFSANTVVREDGCTPFAYKEVVLTINESFSYDQAKPYEPFITVYPSGTAGEGNHYDLFIYEVSNRDTWLNVEGKEFPNGIIISDDWRWPLERTFITTPYPDFSSLTDGWNPDWADNLAEPTKTFDKSSCE